MQGNGWAQGLTLADLQLLPRLVVVQAYPHVAAARHKPARFQQACMASISGAAGQVMYHNVRCRAAHQAPWPLQTQHLNMFRPLRCMAGTRLPQYTTLAAPLPPAPLATTLAHLHAACNFCNSPALLRRKAGRLH